MKSLKTNIQSNLHGHNAPWMLPIWGVIGFFGLNSLIVFGEFLGMLVSVVFVATIFTYLAKNADRMPITMRPDTFEYYSNLRINNPGYYLALKNDSGYFAKEVSDFELIDAERITTLEPRHDVINLNHRQSIKTVAQS